MNFLKRYLCVGGAALFLAGCAHNPVAPPPRELTALEKQLVQADNGFGLKLFREVVATAQPEESVFISPLSVSMALGMTLNGAAGETRAAMEQTLALAGLSPQEINESYQSLIDLLRRLDPRVAFRIANSVWYRDGFPFKQAFLDVTSTYFDAEVRGLDFNDPRAVNVINDWVKKSTRGKIEAIVKSIDPKTVMFLINAIYFKGTWAFKFDKQQTRDDVFYLPDSSQVPVKMMHTEEELPYFENRAVQAVNLPYGNGLFSMLVVLPKPGVDLDSLIAALDGDTWEQWSRRDRQAKVNLAMPKFKLEYEITLNDVLAALGMAVAFDPIQADFTAMWERMGDENLYISEVKHKTFVQVDEEGTEAAAATSVEISVTSAPLVVSMRVDRPFLFAIRENHSGTILFMGKMMRPQGQN